MVTTHHARCAAIMTEPGALRAVAALQSIDAAGAGVRHATVVYAVSPALPNAPDVLAAGLRGRARAWQALTT
ncbi:MAG: hypothetical protein FJX75_26210 [Armatimonadetes bacterium]|nr:hypothetical protein [Armatimonadota bacterium]